MQLPLGGFHKKSRWYGMDEVKFEVWTVQRAPMLVLVSIPSKLASTSSGYLE
jgi:hypothetical protein